MFLRFFRLKHVGVFECLLLYEGTAYGFVCIRMKNEPTLHYVVM